MANFIPKIEYTEKGTGIFKTFTFGNPPEGDPFNESYETSSTINRSNNGKKQTQFNYTRKKYDIKFIYQTEAIKEAFVDMMLNHALKGGKITYYPHSDEVTSEIWEIEDKGFKLPRPIPNGSGDFEYDINFSLEKVI